MPDVLKELKRARARLRRALELVDANAPCHNVVRNLYAAERAIGITKARIIKRHLKRCIESAIGAVESEKQLAIIEYNKIARYL